MLGTSRKEVSRRRKIKTTKMKFNMIEKKFKIGSMALRKKRAME